MAAFASLALFVFAVLALVGGQLEYGLSCLAFAGILAAYVLRRG